MASATTDFVNTSIRLPVDLKADYEAAIKAADPDDDFAKAIRRHMRQAVARHKRKTAA